MIILVGGGGDKNYIFMKNICENLFTKKWNKETKYFFFKNDHSRKHVTKCGLFFKFFKIYFLTC